MSAAIRILNVDDDDGARYAKTRMLQVAGFNVIEAATGGEALSLVKKELPDLVLLDVKLPDINGLDVCKRIKSDPATSTTLVLQTSAALIQRADKVRALEGGADNYLVAPIEAEELKANIKALLRLRQTQQKLAESEDRFRSLVTATSHVVWTTDAAGDSVEDSPSWRAFTGQTYAECKGKGWLNAVHPDDRMHNAKVWEAHVASRTAFQTEYRMRRADGEYRWTEVHAVPLFNPDGTVREWMGSNTDITEHKLSSERIRLADERIQLALNAGAVAGTWFWDIVEDVFTADERFARSFGMDALALEKGLPLAQVAQSIHPEDEPMVHALIARALSHGGDYRAEYRVRQADGEYRWIEANGRVSKDESGRAISFPGVLVDVHQRKLTELRQAALLRLGERLRSLEDAAQIAMAAAETVGETLNVSRAGYGTDGGAT